MAVYKLVRTQLINASVDEVWKFFSNPDNLAIITPPYMKFRVTSEPYTGEIFTGQIISYKVSPILGVPLTWVTEIKEVQPKYAFVDEQQAGPYKLWRHRHTFEPKGDKVLMTDEVEYCLPFYMLGQFAHWLFVKKQLEGIFKFRKKIVAETFPGSEA